MPGRQKGAGRRIGKTIAAAALAAAVALQPCLAGADTRAPDLRTLEGMANFPVGPGASVQGWCEYAWCSIYSIASNSTLIAGATGMNLLLEIVLKAVKSIQAAQMDTAVAMDTRGAAEAKMIEAAFEDYQVAMQDILKALVRARTAKDFDPLSTVDPCIGAGVGVGMAAASSGSRRIIEEEGKITAKTGPGSQPDYARVWAFKQSELLKIKDKRADVTPHGWVYTADQLKTALKADNYRASPHPVRDVADADAGTAAGSKRKAEVVRARAVHGTISAAAATLRDLYTANPGYRKIVDYVQAQDETPDIMRLKPQPSPLGGSGYSPMQAFRMIVDHYGGLMMAIKIESEDEGALARIGLEMDGAETAMEFWLLKLENSLMVLESIETASAVNNAQNWDAAKDPRLNISKKQ